MAEKLVSIRLQEAVQEYVRRMVDRDRPHNTIANTRSQLRILCQFRSPGSAQDLAYRLVRNIAQDDVDNYYIARKKGKQFGDRPRRPLSQSSENHMTSVLNEFFRWCVKKRYISALVDPMDERGYTKTEHLPRRRLTADQFPALLDAARNPRDRALLALLIYTLARSAEITSLTVGDLNLTAQEVAITRTKNKSGVDALAVVAQLDREMRWYLSWYTEQMGCELDPQWHLLPRITWNFVKDGHGRFVKPASPYARSHVNAVAADASVQKITPTTPMGHTHEVVQKALLDLGWEKDEGRYSILMREGAHTLRRSAAREMFEDLRRRGDDDALVTVMSWLGHADTKVTLNYIGIKDKERERRNKLFKGAVMFAHAEPGANVTALHEAR